MAKTTEAMYLCRHCGTFSTSRGVCAHCDCGEEVVPYEEAVGEQGQLFELAGNDRAANVLRQMQSDLSAADDSVRRAEDKLVVLRGKKQTRLERLLDFYKLAVSGDVVDIAVFSETLTEAERNRKVEDEKAAEHKADDAPDDSEPDDAQDAELPMLQCEGCDYYKPKGKGCEKPPGEPWPEQCPVPDDAAQGEVADDSKQDDEEHVTVGEDDTEVTVVAEIGEGEAKHLIDQALAGTSPSRVIGPLTYIVWIKSDTLFLELQGKLSKLGADVPDIEAAAFFGFAREGLKYTEIERTDRAATFSAELSGA